MQRVRMVAAVMSGVCVCVSDRRRLTGLSVWVCNNHSAYFSSSMQACQLSDPYWRQETYYTSAAQKHLFTELHCMTVCAHLCVCVWQQQCMQHMCFYTCWYCTNGLHVKMILMCMSFEWKVYELTPFCPRYDSSIQTAWTPCFVKNVWLCSSA